MTKIICLGDSFTQGYLVEDKNYTRFLEKAGFLVRNLGVNGSTTEEMLERYKRFEAEEREDVLVVFGGTNDFLNGISAQFAYENLKSILEMSDVSKKILIIPSYVEEESIFPAYKMTNDKIDLFYEIFKEDLSYRKDTYMIDSRKIEGRFIDGIHLASDFHEKLTKEILRIVND
ncbi:SGNH/GDSL hydrolase family protein [Anaerococcus marasmi]|uniref:SGNH/GDSL hydrolase family protein n=1 Tax=Anaerococcus marasmi TaxID=2057797 RepID=UPI000CFA0136|nr:SGNH/GDSL hydrolase family protein [Anaerococcus marasmi]